MNPYIGILGLTGLLAVAWHQSGSDYKRSINPCPAETNLGRYGPAARYDGILITGSHEFVGRTVAALRRLDGLKSYRYALALRAITEAELGPRILAQVSGRRAEVDPRTARMSCTLYAGIIVHEGAHVIHARGMALSMRRRQGHLMKWASHMPQGPQRAWPQGFNRRRNAWLIRESGTSRIMS